MPKKPRVRTLMDGQHVKEPERLLKSARQFLCHFFLSLRRKSDQKKYILVVSEILRLFFKILTPDEKYSISVKAGV